MHIYLWIIQKVNFNINLNFELNLNNSLKKTRVKWEFRVVNLPSSTPTNGSVVGKRKEIRTRNKK